MNNLLIIDDEKALLNALKYTFESDYRVMTASNMIEVNETLINNKPDIALVDLRFGEISGLQILNKIKHMYPDAIIVVMTAFGTIETSIKAIKMGAYDYIEKPIDVENLKKLLDNAMIYSQNKKKILIEKQIQDNIEEFKSTSNMTVHSVKMKEIYAFIQKIAKLNVNVLIEGESGTGKELIVRVIHERSSRSNSSIEIVNCGAIPENLIESELFGHVKGAFTGANEDKKGAFERADKGTIFLDEIGEMSLLAQVKLLRVLQEREVQPVGGGKRTKVDVRVIAATNRNLEEEVKEGRFRSDLFYRLNVMKIQVPPLRERKEDIPFLIAHFIEKANSIYGTKVTSISKDALDQLMNYDYKGNIRELENIIYRAVIMSESVIEIHNLPHLDTQKDQYYSEDAIQVKIGSKLVEIEKEAINQTLKFVNGNKAKAARILGISERTIHYKTKK